MKRVRFWIEAASFHVTVALAGLIPRRLMQALGGLAGRIGYALDRRHRRIALDNLEQALGPGLSRSRARAIARGAWDHFGRIVADSLQFPRLGAEDIGRLVHYEGLEHIRRAYARGKGVLLFSAHYGHWELIALMQGHLGMPLALVARPLDNPWLERALARMRSGSGNRVIHKKHAVREILRALRDGEGVAIVLDQDARRTGVFVPFFHSPASTTPTLALMALRTGASVVPTYSVPLADGSYRIVYEPEIPFEPTGDRERDVVALTTRCTERIEVWIRDRPDLWLWMHRRWKTRPSATME